MKTKKNNILLLVALALFTISIGLTIYSVYPEWKNKKQVAQIQKSVIPPKPARQMPDNPIIQAPDTAEIEAEIIKTINPYFIEQREAFDNDDIIGYLQIPDTTIDYLVVQQDNNTFYLDHDIEKNKNIAGWIFMDYENDIETLNKNTVIYGHNMRQDYMFHSIRKYRNEDFYKEHNIITLNTLYEESKWEIFSFYITTTDFYYIQVHFLDEDSFADLLSQMKQRSYYDTEVGVSIQDQILTLSTCTGGSDERYVLNAKLIEKDGKPVAP